MNETMPKFNTEPIKPEEELGFKVEDKRRIDLNKIDEEIKAEKEKKKFDTMTPEQREEWEYNRDQERGFAVKDKRFQSEPAQIDNFKEKKTPEEILTEKIPTEQTEQKIADDKKLESVRESIKPIFREPEIYAWKSRLEEYDNELKNIENDFRDAKIGARTILGFGAVTNELKAYKDKFEKYAEQELSRTTVLTKREVLVDEFAKISQRIDDMNDELKRNGLGKSLNPFKKLGKPFRRIGRLFRR